MAFELMLDLLVDHLLRCTVSMLAMFIPSVDSNVAHILGRLGFVPLGQFFPEYHPRLYTIIEAIRTHLQTAAADNQILEANHRVLRHLHQVAPDRFPELTVGEIREVFAQNWPRICPLPKVSCVRLGPTRIWWGMVDREIDEPILQINPYLIQTLETMQKVRGGKQINHQCNGFSMQWV